MNIRSLSWLCLILCSALQLGCDSRPSRVPVSGQVLIDGQPVTGGYVRFICKEGRPASGDIQADGKSTLSTFDDNDGCIPGQHIVEVIGIKNAPNGQLEITVPQKYHDAATSGLTQTIDKPEPNLVINLTWDKQPPPAPIQTQDSGDLPGI